MLITIGIFSLLSIEINLSIVAAVLTIVGYSMNDTVVIYDRIRENLSKYNKINIDQISNMSVNETLSRTLITSVTTLLALFSIFLIGGEILKRFFLCYDFRCYNWNLFINICSFTNTKIFQSFVKNS